MKLIEQVKRAGYYSLITKEEIIKIEKIADDFAIGFTEWFDDLSEDYCKDYTVKELLEIYKKEKGL